MLLALRHLYQKGVAKGSDRASQTCVYMQNTLAILPMLAITAFSGELQTLMSLKWKMGGIVALVASCVGGLGMSYFSFALRAVISATSFSVIGNVCKVLTILVNLLMWDKHSSKPWTRDTVLKVCSYHSAPCNGETSAAGNKICPTESSALSRRWAPQTDTQC